MKKRKLQKLVLHKHIISNLKQTKAGKEGIEEISKRPVPGICTVDDRCGVPVSRGPVVCITEQGYGFPCTWLICATP